MASFVFINTIFLWPWLSHFGYDGWNCMTKGRRFLYVLVFCFRASFLNCFRASFLPREASCYKACFKTLNIHWLQCKSNNKPHEIKFTFSMYHSFGKWKESVHVSQKCFFLCVCVCVQTTRYTFHSSDSQCLPPRYPRVLWANTNIQLLATHSFK